MPAIVIIIIMKYTILSYDQWVVQEWKQWASTSDLFIDFYDFMSHSLNKMLYQWYVANKKIAGAGT